MTPQKRYRRDSERSIRSVESMSIGSNDGSDSGDEGCADPTVSIVTNASFLADVSTYATKYNSSSVSDKCSSVSPRSLSNSEVSPSPATSSIHSSSPHHGNIKSPPSASSSSCTVTFDIAKMLHALGITTLPEENQNHWFSRLCPLIDNVLRKTSQKDLNSFQDKLKKHVFQRANGELYVSLVGASLLRLHPDLEEKIIRKGEELPKYLPSPIREKLYYGRAVPIRHILYSEALFEGSVVHQINGKKVEAAPYPLNLQKEQPPLEFVLNIRRPDLLRGITTHSLTVGSRFPRLAANMHNLLREVWSLLYQDMVDVQVVMEIYDEFFREFEKRLCAFTLMSMERFPTGMVDYVKSKYTSSRV